MKRDSITDIYEKVVEGERVTYEEGIRLYQTNDLITLGEMANIIRQRKHGDHVYFNKNRHINPTNVCAFHCNFCSFARTSDDQPGAYTYSPLQVVERIRPTVDQGITEFHIVGGLHPELGFPLGSLKIQRLVGLFYLKSDEQQANDDPDVGQYLKPITECLHQDLLLQIRHTHYRTSSLMPCRQSFRKQVAGPDSTLAIPRS